MSEEAVVEAYRLALEKCEEVAQVNQCLKHQVEFLQNKNFELESTVSFLQEIVNCKRREVSMKTELECMKKFVKMLNSGATQLNQILTTRRPGGDHRGLRYARESSSQKTVFVKAKTEVVTPVVSSTAGSNKEKTRRSRIPICHYCKRKGHIRRRCYQYLVDLRRNMPHSSTRKPASRMIW